MIVVVEIANRRGVQASKEYDAPSMSAAVSAAKRELESYPGVHITDVWIKGYPKGWDTDLDDLS